MRVYTYEVVLDVSEVDLRDLLLELQWILEHADAVVDVVLEAVDVRSQIASLSNDDKTFYLILLLLLIRRNNVIRHRSVCIGGAQQVPVVM